jgi:hypothetical protein
MISGNIIRKKKILIFIRGQKYCLNRINKYSKIIVS